MNEEELNQIKIFSRMKIYLNRENELLYFHYKDGDRGLSFKTTSFKNIHFVDALKKIQDKRIQTARNIFPKKYAVWSGDLSVLRNKLIKFLETDLDVWEKVPEDDD